MKNNRIKNIITLLIFLSFSCNSLYAVQAKWDAYPQWGDMLKVYLISLWISISLVFVNIVVSFILKNKEDNKVCKCIKRCLNISSLVLFYSTIVAKIIVELDIFQNAVLYYLIFMFIGAVIFIVFRNNKLFNNIITFIVMFIILVFILLTNNHIYPYEYQDIVYPGGITIDY